MRGKRIKEWNGSKNKEYKRGKRGEDEGKETRSEAKINGKR